MNFNTCSQLGCDARIKSDKWRKIKAQGDNWFFMKDGTSYCPEHIPDWVEAWRGKGNKCTQS